MTDRSSKVGRVPRFKKTDPSKGMKETRPLSDLAKEFERAIRNVREYDETLPNAYGETGRRHKATW